MKMISMSLGILSVCCVILFGALCIAPFIGRHRWSLVGWSSAAASMLIVVTACLAWNNSVHFALVEPFSIAGQKVAFCLDTLSAFFLLPLGLIGFCSSVFSNEYLQKHLSSGLCRYWITFVVFLSSMAAVVLSSNAIVFLVMWELMSLSSALLVATDTQSHKSQRATIIYLAATRIATALLACGFLLMHSQTHSWQFADWSMANNEALVPAILILLGFGIKAGVWPFHIWLPYAHPVAPAPASALMSAVMIKVAIYGMLRIIFFGGLHSTHVALVIFAIGLISSFWGILFALVQRDLKRLLAYSSVENIGLIVTAIGLALYARAIDQPVVASLGLVAALLHVINHALLKGLLFLSAGAVQTGAHTTDLDRLGGLIHKLRWTGASFLVGTMAACAVPSTNAFASKWYLYQSLLHATWQSQNVTERAVCLGGIGVLTIVGGLAIASFSKAFGITFLGRSRSSQAEHAVEHGPCIVFPQLLLACLIAVTGVGVPYIVILLAPLLAAANLPFSLALYDVRLPLLGVFAALVLLVIAIYLLVYVGRNHRRYITWECGFGRVSSRAESTEASFSQPIARIFGPILKYNVATSITGADRRHFPESIDVEPTTTSLLETRVYEPLVGMLRALADLLAKLQTGSIHLYLLYVCITLVLLLLIGTHL